MSLRGVFGMVALSIFPLAATAFAVQFLMPDTIAIHAGFQGIDAWGSKYEAFSLAFIFFGIGVLFTLLYAFADKLYALGLVHGTDARGGRIVSIVSMAFLDVLLVGLLVWMANAAQ